MCFITSHTPIGRTPGFLSTSMRRHTTKGDSNWGERKAEHKRRAKEDKVTPQDFALSWPPYRES